ncbi:MAG: hypothetical protein IJ761_04845 [Bacteroidales bacterium]|nr:hypothetical protein [Bacteroidales bacterium]
MKRIFVFVSIAALIVLIAGGCKQSQITWFDEPGDCVETVSVKVFQAYGNNTALAECLGDRFYTYGYPIVLLFNDEDKLYYDDQVIDAREGQCFRQMGIYRYMTKGYDIKTVPVVQLTD